MTYLTEAKTELSVQEMLKHLKDQARRSHDAAKRSPLFACFNKAPDYFELDPTTWTCPFIIDQALADLKMSTRATACAHCFSNAALAEREQKGELYIILPFDHSRVWIAPTKDYHLSFKHAMTTLRITTTSNSALQEAFAFLGEFNTWKQLKALLNDPDIENLKGDDNAARIAAFKKAPTGLAFFKTLFELEANDFTSLLSSISPPPKREAWVEGSALAILATRYDALYKQGLVK